MNPHMFQEARKNMNPQMMKTASEQLKNMSDDQLNNLAKMAGLNISPDFLKSSANMMSGMSEEELERMKNMASTMNPAGFGAPQGGSSSTFAANEKPQENLFPQIDKFRVKGNELFKSQKYPEAANTYFEGILELVEFKLKTRDYNQTELKKLEIALRSNYCNCKAKTNEFEIVLNQAKEILNLDENNGKAYFRMGQALDYMGRSEAALINLEKAEKLLPNDTTITSLAKSVREKVEASRPQGEAARGSELNQGGDEKQASKTLKKKKVDLDSLNDPKLEESKLSSKEFKEKEKKWEQSSHYLNSKKTEKDQKPADNDVIIEEEIPTNKQERAASSSQQNQNAFPANPPMNRPFGMGGQNANVDQAKASIQQLKNMDPNQLRMMTDTFKSMDKSFLRNMMKSQTGVEMSDAELDNIKNMMTPEMLQMVTSMNLDEMNLPNMGAGGRNFGAASSGANTSSTEAEGSGAGVAANIGATGSGASGLGAKPSLSSILQNQGMISSMMENMKKNPEMLKSMSKMLGENHPLSSMLEKSRPEDLSRMIGFMQGLLKLVGKVTALYRYLKLHKFKILGALGLYLAYKYF